jgi:hypothetical protein
MTFMKFDLFGLPCTIKGMHVQLCVRGDWLSDLKKWLWACWESMACAGVHHAILGMESDMPSPSGYYFLAGLSYEPTKGLEATEVCVFTDPEAYGAFQRLYLQTAEAHPGAKVVNE